MNNTTRVLSPTKKPLQKHTKTTNHNQSKQIPNLPFPANKDHQNIFKYNFFSGNDKEKKSNCSHYKGQIKNGQRHGFGIYYYADKKEKYKGYWQNDMRHGSGEYFFENGSVFRGIFVDDVPNGRGVVKGKKISYFGDWEKGRMVGRFKFVDHENKISYSRSFGSEAKKSIFCRNENHIFKKSQFDKQRELLADRKVSKIKKRIQKLPKLVHLFSLRKPKNELPVVPISNHESATNLFCLNSLPNNEYKRNRFSSLSTHNQSYIDFSMQSPVFDQKSKLEKEKGEFVGRKTGKKEKFGKYKKKNMSIYSFKELEFAINKGKLQRENVSIAKEKSKFEKNIVVPRLKVDNLCFFLKSDKLQK